MSIIMRLDVLLAQRKIKSRDLASAIGITEQNVSLLKQGKIKGLRFSTLDAICRFLECQPGDLLIYSQDVIPRAKEWSALDSVDSSCPHGEAFSKASGLTPPR